jgi:hypothetical protein
MDSCVIGTEALAVQVADRQSGANFIFSPFSISACFEVQSPA